MRALLNFGKKIVSKLTESDNYQVELIIPVLEKFAIDQFEDQEYAKTVDDAVKASRLAIEYFASESFHEKQKLAEQLQSSVCIIRACELL